MRMPNFKRGKDPMGRNSNRPQADYDKPDATDNMTREWWKHDTQSRDVKYTPVAIADDTFVYIFNKLPPGQLIEQQELAHVSKMVRKNVQPSGYPDSGGFPVYPVGTTNNPDGA